MVATLITWLAALYLAIGLGFALVFVRFGAPRIDSTARGTPISFQLMILPGTALLWPILLGKWRRAARAGGAP